MFFVKRSNNCPFKIIRKNTFSKAEKTVVIGRMSELIQDFKRRVGMKSKEQVASEEEK